MPRLEGGRETLGEFAETWWRTYAIPNLAPKTRRIYAELWDRHALPRIGGMTLRKLSPRWSRVSVPISRRLASGMRPSARRSHSSRACSNERSSGDGSIRTP